MWLGQFGFYIRMWLVCMVRSLLLLVVVMSSPSAVVCRVHWFARGGSLGVVAWQ
jgi:hypothetical protein